MSDVETIAGWLRDAQQIVVLTGAGISTESGIPDFRGPEGMWTKDPAAERRADIRYYIADADVRRRAWRDRVERPMWDAEPNAGHRALAELESRAVAHARHPEHRRPASTRGLVARDHRSRSTEPRTKRSASTAGGAGR